MGKAAPGRQIESPTVPVVAIRLFQNTQRPRASWRRGSACGEPVRPPFCRYTALAAKGEAALDAGDMAALGRLLDENHALCQELTVSCKELDDLVVAARGAGAVGAKMSGTGRGGLMLALTPTAESQAAVAKALEKLAPQVWMTTFA